MEFEEMKKVWDEQNKQPLYVIDEKALQNRIHSKMKIIRRVTSISEWALILINLSVAVILMNGNPLRIGANIFLYFEAVWMFGLVLYLLGSRVRRVRASRQFDRSIRGDLDHAISLANYQMHLSQIVRWNFLPMGVLLILSGWEEGKLLKVAALILVSYSLAFYVTSKGYRMNKRRKLELEGLKEKLDA